MFNIVAFLALILLFSCSQIVNPCSVLKQIYPEELLLESKYIIWATAVDNKEDKIQFRIRETLKGRPKLTELTIDGSFSSEDDFNDHSVPYRIARPTAREGMCYSTKYKKGADYLLFLQRQNDFEQDSKELSPYWAPLAPVNEQLRSKRDPWLLWVKNRLPQKD